MQAWSRAAGSLWSACSSAGRLAARSFASEAAAGGAPLAAAEKEGAKSKLFGILRTAAEPLTAAQVWEAAAPLGLKSKRFTKQMLQELRDAGWVKTQPLQAGKKHKSFGYRLNQTMQQQRAAAETRQAAGSAA